MIVVIADDLSGAAELGGVAIQNGLTAEVHTEFDPSATCDVVSITTDSRALPENEAAARVEIVARQAVAAKPDWIYKKTDSVLRGNVRVEIEAVLRAAGLEKAIFVPANPRKGRLIRGGCYFIHEQPLHETAFGRDPDHPRITNEVRALLGDSARIEIPDIPDAASLHAQARRFCHDSALPAGAAEFFEALCSRERERVAEPPPATRSRSRLLLICGSHAAWELGRESHCRSHGIAVSTYPFEDLSENPGSLALAIGNPGTSKSPAELLRHLTETAARLIFTGHFDRLLLEGGATATAVMEKMGWSRFRVLPTEGDGIANLEIVGAGDSLPTLCIKPGSYDWPAEVLKAARI